MYSVIIAGSRTIDLTVEEIDRAIYELDPSGFLWVPEEWRVVVSGRARGMDRAGEAWARAKGKRVHPEPVTPEDYAKHGKYLAPKMRNHRMANIADGALLFWDGTSGGTADMCIRMNLRDKPVRSMRWDTATRSVLWHSRKGRAA